MRKFENLEYKIGGMEFEKEDEVVKGMKFGLFIVTVGTDDKVLTLYLLDGRIRHKIVAEHFNIPPYPYKGHWMQSGGGRDTNQEGDIVGGGFIIYEKGELQLVGSSGDYGAIPQRVGENLLSLVDLELKKANVTILQLKVHTDYKEENKQYNHNPFWDEILPQ